MSLLFHCILHALPIHLHPSRSCLTSALKSKRWPAMCRASSRRSGGFIKLNTNENPYPPSPAVAAAIEEAVRRGLQKYPDPLAGAFRRRAAEVLGVPPGLDPGRQRQRRHPDDRHPRPCRRRGNCCGCPIPATSSTRRWPNSRGAAAKRSVSARLVAAGRVRRGGATDLRLVFLANPNSPSGTVVPPGAGAGAGRAAALPALGRRGLRRFRRDELPGPGRAEREDPGLADV